MASGKLLRSLEGPSSVTAMAFSLDGRTLASGSIDDTIKLWDMASGKLLRTIEGHSSYVASIAFSLDGRTLASGSSDDTIKLWEMASGRLLRTLEGYSSVYAVAFSPDGKTLASGNDDKTIRLWEMVSGKLLRTLEGHSSSVTAVAFSPDGNILASGSSEGDTSLRFWQTSNGNLLTVAYAIDKNDYIIYSPQGYFAASKNAERFAAWRIGNEVYTFEQYSEQFNRPDLIARILAGEEVPPPTIRGSREK
jgi:WD40 repeat protein